MKLSEALKHGLTLRPEHHQDVSRFCYVSGVLHSDAWGAAVEAVMPTVKDFNWGSKDPAKVAKAEEACIAVQYHYFHAYQHMPVVCPGSEQRFVRAGGRVVSGFGRKPEYKLDSVQTGNLGGVTSECEKVSHLYGMVDHLFYAHGWSRQQVAEVVEWYEQERGKAAIFRNFKHYQVSGVKHLGGVQ